MAIPIKYIGNAANEPTDGFPREIPPNTFNYYQPFSTNLTRKISDITWGNAPIKAGSLFLTTQGNRLVLEVGINRVIYILVHPSPSNIGKIYIQVANGFIGDVTSYPYEKAGNDLRPIASVAVFEVQVLIGILSTLSGAALATVMGADVLVFVLRNPSNFKKWGEIIKACVQTHSDIKKYTPTLYNKLLHEIVLAGLKGAVHNTKNHKGEINESLAKQVLTDPNSAGRGVGVLVGKVGVAGLNGRISVLSAVWTVLSTTVTKMLSAVPGAAKSKLQELGASSIASKEELAKKLFTMLYHSDVAISQDEARKITEEVMAHPAELKASFSNLYEVFNRKDN